MKIELGQFYLGANAVWLFLEEKKHHYEGKAWQGGLLHNFNSSKDQEFLKELTPITPEIAKLALFSQDIYPPNA